MEKLNFMYQHRKQKPEKRTVPMMDAVYQAFRDEYEAQKRTGFNIEVCDGMSGFIFANRNGGLHNPSTINRAIRRIYESHNAEEIVKAKKEKGTNIDSAFLLSSYETYLCTRLCEVEENIKVAQDIMGHADIGTTLNIYAEANDEAKLKAVNSMQKKI